MVESQKGTRESHGAELVKPAIMPAPQGAAAAAGQVSPSSHGELFRFRGGTSLLSGPGGSPHLRLSRCKRPVPKFGQTALPQIPCGNGSSERKRLKKKKRLNKANHAFVLGQLIFWSFYNSTYSRTVPWVAVFVRLRLMDALECNFRVSVSITGKPREFGYGYKATTPSRSEPQASTTAGRIQKLHKRIHVFV